jgi:hypothetical protein
VQAFDLIRAIDAPTFLGPETLDERVALAMRTAGRRLYSHHLANAWLDWIGTHSREIGRHDIELLAREALRLSPLHERAEDLYKAVMRPSEPQPERRVVFMVTSCVKYFASARRVQQALRARGAVACIVIGDPTRRVATWDGDVCTLPVADSYEGLPLKVAAGVNAIVARFGAVAVVKIDDDCELTPRFSIARFEELARQHDYVGKPHRDIHHCRYWHFGKTALPQGPYTRRFHGAWAGGACYLLNARAAGLVAREYALYPAEIGDEYYEDKAVGDFLRRQGVALHAIRHDEWGITYDPTERFTVPAANPRATTESTLAVGPVAERSVAATIPRLLHIVWLGDAARRPDNLIATWISHHPGWTVKVWGNEDLAEGHWHCAAQMAALGASSLPALAALMKWEILYREGGVSVAADSLCIRGLDAALLGHERFGCYLSESAAPGVLSAGYFGCMAGDALVARLLDAVGQDGALGSRSVSDAVGDDRLTAVHQASPDLTIHVLPSHVFLPMHLTAAPHPGTEGVVACELWASALGLWDDLASFSIESLRAVLKLDDHPLSQEELTLLEEARSALSS